MLGVATAESLSSILNAPLNYDLPIVPQLLAKRSGLAMVIDNARLGYEKRMDPDKTGAEKFNGLFPYKEEGEGVSLSMDALLLTLLDSQILIHLTLERLDSP